MRKVNINKYNIYSRSKFIWILKIGLASFLIFHLYGKIESQMTDLNIGSNYLSRIFNCWFYLAILLMPINWIFETLKYKLILKTLPFKTALESILLGVTCGLFTFLKLGEYPGRLIPLQKKQYSTSINSTLLSSLSQNAVHFFFGFISFFYLLDVIEASFNEEIFLLKMAFFISLGILLSIVIFYRKIIGFVEQKVKKYFQSFKHFEQLEYSNRDLLKMGFLSLARFIVYSCQYYCLVQALGFNVPVMEAFTIIWLIFLLQSILPLPPVMSLLARGEVAILLWPLFGVGILNALMVSFLIWIINIVTPSLCGIVVFLKFKNVRH